MPSQLSLYNDALLICGERFLASLTEEREPRRLLDNAWANNPVKACLEMGQWNFAMRTVQIDYDSTIEPDFGYHRAFEKPSDWVLTSALCEDEFFRVPSTRYWDEAGYWYADVDTLYVRYVSNAVTYGMDMNKWPESFREYVAEFLASKVILKITGSEEKETKSLKRLEKKLSLAKSKAAMAAATSFPPRGSWSAARNRMAGGTRDRTGGNLIG